MRIRSLRGSAAKVEVTQELTARALGVHNAAVISGSGQKVGP